MNIFFYNCRFLRKFAVAFLFVLCATCISLWADTSYTVKKGDTLYSISRAYQITVAELCAANNFSQSDILKVGKKLIIPAANISNAAALSSAPVSNEKPVSPSPSQTYSYVVKKGDTLYGISKKFNMNLSELISLNNMQENVLKAGQTIRVIGSTTSSTATASSKSSSSSSTATATLASMNNAQIVWPLSNPTVQNVSGKVSGVKLLSESDNAVTAVRSGTVMYVGAYRGFGQVVFVESKTGLIYAYTWLSAISVKKGDYVVYGDTLGRATKEQDSGKQTVTFMVFQNGTPVDPSRAPRG